MRIAFIGRRHPPTRKSPIIPEVVRLLQEWGAEVDLLFPEEELLRLDRIEVRHDLYVLRSASDLALSLAGALDAAGARILNPYAVTAALRNKIVSTHVLLAAGIPVPDTFVAGRHGDLVTALEGGPLVVKPYQGTDGRGVRVVWDGDDLSSLDAATDEPVFAMRYHPADGRDRKIYCIGGQLFGVKRTWPVRTYTDKLGEPFTLDADLRRLALACGDALGVDLFGVDVIESEGQRWVVDMSSFPGFKGVPDAALRLADYVFAAARDARSRRAVAGVA